MLASRMRFSILLLALILTSCSKKEAPPPAAAEGAAGQTQASATPWGERRLTLVTPGSEPRVKLRRGFTAGLSQTLELRVGLAAGAYGEPREIPNSDVRYTLRLETQGVSEDGSEAVVELTIVGAEAAQDGVQAWLVEVIKEFDREFQGTTIQYTVRSHGTVDPIRFGSPDDATAEERSKKISALQGALMVLALALPGEAVGQGAQWTHVEAWEGEQEGDLEQRTTYELTKLDGSKVEIQAEIEQRVVSLAAHPAAQWATGTRKVTWDLSKLAPSKATHAVTWDRLVSPRDGTRIQKTTSVEVVSR
jgi:hypothetical protein